MNETEHLLTVLTEECCEVAERACKAARFGMTEVEPGQPDDNKRRIEKELADLVATAELLGFTIRDEDKAAKREKLKKYMDYARKLGTLDQPKADLQKALERCISEGGCVWSAQGEYDGCRKGSVFSPNPCAVCAARELLANAPQNPKEGLPALCETQVGCFRSCGKLLPCPDHASQDSPGVFCLEHRKVMVDGVCPKCVAQNCLHPGVFRGEKCKTCNQDVR